MNCETEYSPETILATQPSIVQAVNEMRGESVSVREERNFGRRLREAERGPGGFVGNEPDGGAERQPGSERHYRPRF